MGHQEKAQRKAHRHEKEDCQPCASAVRWEEEWDDQSLGDQHCGVEEDSDPHLQEVDDEWEHPEG